MSVVKLTSIFVLF